jgi:hypothetical protein
MAPRWPRGVPLPAATRRQERDEMNRALQDPILDDGLSFTAYFNGRLLSSEDLARDQRGNRDARRRIGQAVGDGVAFGLDVFEAPGESTKNSPVVTVQPGVAINRRGHALSLQQPINLQLVRSTATGTDVSNITAFRVCDPVQPGVYVTGEGVYVLAMTCAEGGEGRAPVSGLGGGAGTCNVRSVTEGVQFRLVKPVIDLDLLADEAHLRNRIAGFALGLADRIAPYADPMAPTTGDYGLADSLRANGALSDDDVPLALLHWTAASGITFVDMWSIRRGVMSRGADRRWKWLSGDCARMQAEATFLQFQEQIDDIVASGDDLSTIAAVDRFDFLPPLGLLPLQLGTRAGFDLAKFFGPDVLSRDIAMMDGTLLRSLVRESFTYDPIVLADSSRIQLYSVFENVNASVGDPTVVPVAVFASHTLPYRGVARFGIARWEQGRLVHRVI